MTPGSGNASSLPVDGGGGRSGEEEDMGISDAEILFEFVVSGVLLIGIGALGLVGNVISVAVLTRPQMKSSINVILVGLASVDTILVKVSHACMPTHVVTWSLRGSRRSVAFERKWAN